MTGLTIAAVVVAVLLAAMLMTALVQINGLGTKVDELAGKLRTINAKPTAPELPTGLEERLLAIEAGMRAIPAAYGRLERSILIERRERQSPPPTPSSSTPTPPQNNATMAEPDQASESVSRGEGLGTVPSPTGNGLQGGASVEGDNEQPVSPDELIESYRELIARPRKNEITRWFDDLDGTPCEATDENVFQLLGRGEGARLVLVRLTERFGLVLPSALMVVDFATSFADVLSARSATRQTFAFDADGSGTLRLVQPAMAVLVDGSWKLKAPGRLAGLASG